MLKQQKKESKILLGSPVRERILDQCKSLIYGYKLRPKLVILTAEGYDHASSIYIRNKINTCIETGVIVEVKALKWEGLTRTQFLNLLFKEIDQANNDESIDGYFIQCPLPHEISISDFNYLIDPNKDVDGFNAENLGNLFDDENYALTPCTSKAVIDTLDYYYIDLEGSDVVIVNRSKIVGIPLIPLLLNRNATITVCHSKTKDLKEKCKRADVVITAIGKAEFMDHTYFKDDAVIIDVSINRDIEGKLCGDVKKADYDKLNITPVPKGVGVITTANVIYNVVKACLIKNKVRF